MKKMAICLMLVSILMISGNLKAADDALTLALWNCDSTITVDGDIYVPDDNSNSHRPTWDLNLSETATGLGDPTLTTGGGGISGEALSFYQDYALARDIWNGYESVTVDFWMNINELPTTSGVPIMYLFRTGVWDMTVTSDDKLQWTARNSSGSAVGYIRKDISGMENQWIHVIATFSQDLSMTLTVDGSTDSTTASAMWWLRTGDSLQVGYQTGKAAERAFNGLMDDIKISVPTLQEKFSDDWQTIALLHMDSEINDANGSYVPDDNTNTGRNTNDLDISVGASSFGDPSLTIGSGGVFGEALVFDEDFAVISDAWNGYDSVNIDFWLYIDQLPSTSGAAVMYIMQTGAWDLTVNSSNQMQWTVRNGSGSGVGYIRHDLNGLENQWMHVNLSFNTDLTLGFTLNRVELTSTASEMWQLPTGADIQIGARVDRSADRGLKGKLDELKISIPTLTESPSYVHIYENDEYNVFGLWHMDQVTDKDGIDVVEDDDSDSLISRDHDMILVESSIGGGIMPVIDGNEYPEPFGAVADEFASSMYFDGWVDQYLEADTGTSDMLGIDLDNVRYEGWYKVSPDAIAWEQSGGSWSYEIVKQYLVAKLTIDRYFNSDGSTNFWQIIARFRLNDENGDYLGEYVVYNRFYGDSSPLLDGWHHVAAEYETGEVRLFIDGSLVDSDNTPPVTAYIRNTVAEPVRIGGNFWGWIDEVRVSRATFSNLICGEWGYPSADINYDCYVNSDDLKMFASNWLQEKTDDPSSNADDYPDLTSDGWPILGNYNVPEADIVPTIDAVVSTGEWQDARRIEMVYPDFMTAPNVGHIRPGGAANASIAPDNEADFSLYWFVKWDTENLYLLGVVYDDIIVLDNGKDEPQFCFNYLNEPNSIAYSDAYIWYLDSDGIGGDDTGGGSVPANTLVAYSNYGDHYVIETKMPWTDLDPAGLYVPTVGDIHGFGFLAQDHDKDGDREHFFWDHDIPDIESILDVSMWNTITLVSAMPCGEDGFDKGDYNESCGIELLDFAALATDWLLCSNPQDEMCSDLR